MGFKLKTPAYRIQVPGAGSELIPLDIGHWTLDFLLRFHPLATVVHEFMDEFLTFPTDKTTQAGFPDMITAHIHAVITTVEQLAALSLITDRAHKHIFRQSSLPGRQQGYFEPSR